MIITNYVRCLQRVVLCACCVLSSCQPLVHVTSSAPQDIVAPSRHSAAALPASTAGNARSADFGQLLPKIDTPITGVGMSCDVAETHDAWWEVGTATNTSMSAPQVVQTVQAVVVPYMSWLCSKTHHVCYYFWQIIVGEMPG